MIIISLLNPLQKTHLQQWTFNKGDVVRIGRSADNDVVLYSAVVSRHHAEISWNGQGWSLKSLGTNGTYVDGRRIDEAMLQDGAVIRLARSGPKIQVHLAEAGQRTASPMLQRPIPPPPPPPAASASSTTEIPADEDGEG